ncbi:uncharacterized protein LOC115218468 [Octopus sinensis]|uniref:Uncharacterized protein LOC115218468 n=1 Tax=Octopus sinensis TaxID=2607531 RepID=A0A6P7T1C6_9MOLL|nr:uncharacterized protein LOC115218468 [Octopus sinensis]
MNTTMYGVNIIFYSAIMVCLGTGAIMNLEPKMTEDEIIYERAVLKKLTKNLLIDRMIENNAADNEPQNENPTNEVAEKDGLKNSAQMQCSWKGNAGKCCTYLRHLPKLCVRMAAFEYMLQFSIELGGFVLIHRTYHGTFSKTYSFHYGTVHIQFKFVVERISHRHLKACFKISYEVQSYHFSKSLGCINKHFPAIENIHVNSISDLSSNGKISFEAQEFETGNLNSMEYLGEENQNKNVLI